MSEPIKHIHYTDESGADRSIILLGTAHVSKESVESVKNLIEAEQPDTVCVELDDDRYRSLTDEKKWQELDITQVLKSGKGFFLLANLALASFQKRIGLDMGVKPGDELKEAVTVADQIGAQMVLVDRPVYITLKRAWAKESFWGRSKLLASLMAGVFTKERPSKEEIEALKQQGAMDSVLQEVAKELPSVKEVLIDERDRYLASKIFDCAGNKKLAVLGAGHLGGTEAFLQKLINNEASSSVTDLDRIPPPTLFRKLMGFALPALIVVLLVIGAINGGVKASSGLFVQWMLWNSICAAIGTALAFGSPLTILVGFLTAPISTLSPILGVGMFTGLTQATVRKPQVIDAEQLSDDVIRLKGWYTNKIAHVLLIFVASSIGSAIGNTVAISSIFTNLFFRS